ncbi:hypothetical protein WA1_06550 [Scytonema hofmannii PCC 7110]|uniref:Uncharacterized protein n=1 Tax=Scytonema hofmannii PCC 7110 TaxID=128403 RepID=A0A139WSS4_9CYAN|nr:hypothetical protein [Scytonema hofmannii]KYC35481.1 hypothetical protein WA1_06550 [Scytonema hofmannii PCC 7110]
MKFLVDAKQVEANVLALEVYTLINNGRCNNFFYCLKFFRNGIQKISEDIIQDSKESGREYLDNPLSLALEDQTRNLFTNCFYLLQDCPESGTWFLNGKKDEENGKTLERLKYLLFKLVETDNSQINKFIFDGLTKACGLRLEQLNISSSYLFRNPPVLLHHKL